MTNAARPGSGWFLCFTAASFLILAATLPHGGIAAASTSYVGSEACRHCHEREYDTFVKFSRKAKSFESVDKLKKGLSGDEVRGCYACHTTGYGKPGGFVSPEETPALKNAGCEVCHGPGGLHCRTGRAGDIKRRLTKEDCEVCHTSQRVKAFRYKPLIHGYAH